MNKAQKQQVESLVDDFIEKLPHGSGINCNWHWLIKGQFVCFTNSYHVMNDVGFYVGYQDFTVKIPIAPFLAQNFVDMAAQFVLQFNGNQYLAQYYMLRDYLTDTIYFALRY